VGEEGRLRLASGGWGAQSPGLEPWGHLFSICKGAPRPVPFSPPPRAWAVKEPYVNRPCAKFRQKSDHLIGAAAGAAGGA